MQAAIQLSTVVYTKVEPGVVKKHRAFFKSQVKRAFVKWCAYEGFFNGVLTKEEIKAAKKGHLPSDLDVHHILPLSGSYSDEVNEFRNLTILHKSVHQKINKEYFQPQLKNLLDKPFGTKMKIIVPIFDFVDAQNIINARKHNSARMIDLSFCR